ncbi:MAG: inner membrane CreD family protein [Gemmatimonadota bacterium]|nr:inner membrane CreD family protein [Gemmatimonadota bacterium]
MIHRIIAIGLIFVCISVAWLILGQTVHLRTMEQDGKLKDAVGQLWGTSQTQQAPQVYRLERITRVETDTDGQTVSRTVDEKHYHNLAASRIDVDLSLEHRRKGLLWYSTYNVQFAASYTLSNPTERSLGLYFDLELPARRAVYDDFTVGVDSLRIADVPVRAGHLVQPVDLAPGQILTVLVSYRSRGLDQWRYSFGEDVSQVTDFELVMQTDFADIDFPAESVSPTSKIRTRDAWTLTWRYDHLLTGVDLGMVMPARLNPGPWVRQVVLAAPVSLFLFFFLLFVFTTVRCIDLHPMHYFFIGAAFFSFHLLLAYLVDHMLIHYAFVLASAVSIFLVISYMRLVVGARLAFVEIGAGQFIYLVLFSYTFFFSGYTGLAITLLCIATLFAAMQYTGRTNWNTVFEKKAAPSP